MLDDEQWQGDAGVEVRKRAIALDRANHAVEQAARDLRKAQEEQKVVERDFNTAKAVYVAGRRDQENRIGAPNITLQKREWLKSLAKYVGFGAGEMRAAAASVGWHPTDTALRVLASEYRKVGYFIQVKRGFMQLDRDRISAVIGDIFSEHFEPDLQSLDVDGTQANLRLLEIVEMPEMPEVAGSPVKSGHDNDLDFLDDDTPF